MNTLCDGVSITWTDSNSGQVQRKEFTVRGINRAVPTGCYDEFGDYDDDEGTPLAFLVREYDYGTTVSFDCSVVAGPFSSWMSNDCIRTHAVWAFEEDMMKHLKYLKGTAKQPKQCPRYPLVVSYV